MIRRPPRSTPLSLHDALPISAVLGVQVAAIHLQRQAPERVLDLRIHHRARQGPPDWRLQTPPDRKSTRLNSSHANISYAVFCLKKKKNIDSCLATHEVYFATP